MVLILKHSDIARLLDRDEVRKAVELAHAGLARGDWQNPAPRSMHLPGDGSAIPMTAASGDSVVGQDAVRSAREPGPRAAGATLDDHGHVMR